MKELRIHGVTIRRREDMEREKLHQTVQDINVLHWNAHPHIPTPEEITGYTAERDRLIAKLKSTGKRVFLVHADWLEEAGRYVCEGDDGVNGYDPLPGSITTEEEV